MPRFYDYISHSLNSFESDNYNMASTYNCIDCKRVVTSRQHAVQCDTCNLWQHRLCNTNITYNQYRQMMKKQITVNWECGVCQQQPMEIYNSTTTESEHPPPDINVSIINNTETNLSEFSFRSPSPTRSIINLPPLQHSTSSPIQHTISENERIQDIPDVDFDITGRNYDRPEPIVEQSIGMMDEMDDYVPDDGPVKFEEVTSGTKRGGRKLVSSDGYTYTVKRSKDDYTYWYCSVRSNKIRCRATVSQKGNQYRRGMHGHGHAAEPGAMQRVKVAAKVKKVARDQVFRSAAEIVETVMKETIPEGAHSLPKPQNLTRAANLHRQNLRPTDPKPDDLGFDVQRDFIKAEEFLVDDFKVDSARHLIFATRNQLSILSKCKKWFVDGTFKIVKKPFVQLFSVHGFIKEGETAMQVPLAFVLMSRRMKKDYAEVLRRLLASLEDPLVEWVMADYESAIWQAVREVCPSLQIRGCVFHWTQRIYKKIQTLGLTTAYTERKDKYIMIRKLMALPYLPHEQIRRAFIELQDQLPPTAPQQIEELMSYIQKTWIDGTVWNPRNWSAYREPVRTNNDVEGWHRRINGRAGRADLGFYVLVPLLFGEAQTVDLQMRLISENLLQRTHRKQYQKTHGQLFDLWDKYDDEEITTKNLLRECSYIIGLGPTTTSSNNYLDDEN